SETSRERRLNLTLHVSLCAGELGGVAGEEVVSGLLGVEHAYRWQDPESVGAEEKDRLGMTCRARRHVVVDVLQGVSGTGVLGDVIILVVHLAALAVHGDVLQHAPEADGIVDLWLLLSREVYGLRVAA